MILPRSVAPDALLSLMLLGRPELRCIVTIWLALVFNNAKHNTDYAQSDHIYSVWIAMRSQARISL